MEYTEKIKKISKIEFINFESMRVLGGLLGRLLNSKYDYMAAIFADTKYTQHERIAMMPEWLKNALQSGGRIGITEDSALTFIKNMLQSNDLVEQIKEGIK